MPAMPLSRAWTVLLWSAAVLYPVVLLVTMEQGQSGFVDRQVIASVLLTGLMAALMPRHPLPAHGVLLFSWTAAVLVMPIGSVAALQLLITDLGVGHIAATRRRRISVPVAAGTFAVQFLSTVSYLSSSGVLLMTVFLAAAVCWLVGDSAQVRQANARRLREQATAQAVAAERLRIARELHDMVAHSIGIIAIQAGVGGRVIDTQPAEARNALDAIEATSRDVLSGLRRMLTALRRDDPGATPLGPSPGLDDLGRLAEAAKDAGVRVDVRWKGERRPLPPDVDQSAYRIVQEAVTNVVRHAGTSECQVTVRYGAEELSIEVDDDGHGGVVGAGYGIIGMRERVGLLRGEFAAGPRPDGGFRVSARIPTPVAAAAA
ncbi:sensor histidine kinase [Spirillospora sp. NBC_00431]